MLKKALSMNPRNPITNLELGIFYFSRSMYDEARDYFETTIEIAPNTEFSTKAVEYLNSIKQRGAVKSWTLNISAGGQYDSNVIINSDNSPLPEGISRKSDWKAIFYLKGKYNLFKNERAESSVGYSFYQSLHTKLSDFNITNHLFELNAAYHISPVVDLKGKYSFEHILVGGDPYDYAHSISPSLVISEGKGFSTVVEYRYRNIHFMDTKLFEDNSDRTGSNNLFGITQNIPIGASVIFRIGYSYDVDSTREDFWDYRGNKGMVGLQFNLPSYIYINLYGEYYQRDYKGESPLSGEERKDKASTASINATKLLSDRFSITLGQLYTRNKSNIEEFDYKRAITSLFLNVRF
jgi:tetratricopeptide (TPR) repeat protein